MFMPMKNRRYIVLLFLWPAWTFGQAHDWYSCDPLPPVCQNGGDLASFPAYFPMKQAGRDAAYNAVALDTFYNEWYSKALSQMQEPILMGDSSGREIYRLSCHRSFREPIIVRIEKIENYIIINYSTLNYIFCDTCEADYQWVLHSKAKLLAADQWEKMQAQIQRIDFWTQPAEDPTPSGLDGSTWILEGLTQGKYHFAARWSPPQGDAFRECCLFLLELAGGQRATLVKD